MIAALLTKVGLEAGLKTGGRMLGLIIIAACLVLAGLAFWRGMVAIERMEFAAYERGRAEETALWTAAIANSNAVAEKARADQAIAAARASAESEARITDLTKMLAEWEAHNAAKPDAACLDAGDINDLNRLRRPGVTGTNGANRAR